MSPIRARTGAALRALRQRAATPRRLAVRVGKRRVVASVDPPRGVARVSVRPVQGAGAVAGARAPKHLGFTVRRRRLAATLNRATGTLEVRISRLGRTPPPPPARATAPPEPSISPRAIVAAPPEPVVEPAPAASPEPPAPSRRVGVWLAAVAAAVALALAGAAAAIALTRDGASKTAPIVTSTERATAPIRSAPRSTTAPQRTAAPRRTTTPRPPATTTVVAGTRQAETKPPPPVPSSARTITWKAVPGARLYLFEVLRQGSLGRTEVLQEWPAGAELRLPPGLVPGLYSWSASPEARRGATVRSTIFTRAGRFRITESGRLVRLG